MGRFVEEENGDAVREAKVLHASILCNGDETQKSWKPLPIAEHDFRPKWFIGMVCTT